MKSAKEVVSILSRYTPCDVSDALVQFGVKNGGYIPNLVQRSPAAASDQVETAAGPAYTVLYAPKSDPRPAVSTLYIDEIPEGSMLVMGLPLSCQMVGAPYAKINNALYGGLMSTRAHYRGAKGSVVLGRIRDLDEHNDLGYPVWSYGVSSTAPGPVVKVVGINVPIEVKVACADEEHSVVLVKPNDYIIADKNGVVRLPVDHSDEKIDVNQVLDYIPKRVDADRNVAEDIKKGRPAAEAQKFWRGKI